MRKSFRSGFLLGTARGPLDPAYEEGGHDYPAAFVRWTVQRNFEAVLDMKRDGRLDASPLITHRFPIASFASAYGALEAERPLGIVIEYEKNPDTAPALKLRSIDLAPAAPCPKAGIAFVGAGNWTLLAR